MTSSQPSYGFADLELSRRLERTEGTSCARLVSARAKVFPGCGAEWIEIVGTYAMFDGPTSPVTQTFGLGLFAAIGTAELARLEQFFQERGAAVNHEVSPLAGIPLLRTLSERGYRPIEVSSVMYRPIHRGVALGRPTNDRIHARPCGAGEQEHWAQTAALGWSEVGDFSVLMRDVAAASSQCEGAIPFLAEREGDAIAAASLIIVGSVALLAGASTIPAARKQGAQLALLETRLRHAAERGCDTAMMCAEPGSASQRNAERHGFRIAYTRTKWQLAGGAA